MDQAIQMYFELGMDYAEILCLLAKFQGIVLSMRTLKRYLHRLGLYRRKNYSGILDVALFLTEEIKTSGKLFGYKLMHLKCLQKGLVVTQESVRQLLKIIDPEGVESRRRHRLRRRVYTNLGPNFLWHMDSYDKLKPYGICINGAIDGFSRFIVWLEANRSNSDPKIIAGYFMESVKKRMGCPARLRADMGTENGHVKQMLMILRTTGRDQYANACYLTGSSNHNQRIERWWGTLRKQNAQYWMTFFSMMADLGCFTGTFLDKALIQFCFMDLIQEELDTFVRLWNSHRIRRSRNQNAPNGRPVIMYTCPEVYDSRDYLHTVTDNQINVCCEECEYNTIKCDETVYELCNILMEECHQERPTSAEEAVLLYQLLRNEILNELNLG